MEKRFEKKLHQEKRDVQIADEEGHKKMLNNDSGFWLHMQAASRLLPQPDSK